MCTECRIAKAQQTKLNKLAEKREYEQEENWSFYLSTFKSDKGKTKHWVIFVDWATRYQRSYFIKNKSDLSEKGLIFVREMEQKNRVKINFFGCNKAGENKKFEEILR